MWTPKEVRKLLAQIAGILFGGGGIALMIGGINATGKINISSNMISGQIESGSAGLLLLFFSFFLILLPSIHLNLAHNDVQNNARKKGATKATSERKGISDLFRILMSVLISTGLTFAFFLGGKKLGEIGHESFGNFVTVGGFLFGIVTGILIIISLFGFIVDGLDNSENGSTETKADSTK